ncbi:hypothetical protein LTR53_014580 [Teratosphaeriaceae sp. CCFEE 6253]|nr:hypothetical protein LTR53_014580 [Teratosphaeriaceae sp. CCFEE 6253]
MPSGPAADDDCYGSEPDDRVLSRILSICEKAHSYQEIEHDSDYGSELDDDVGSDYGSDVDDSTVEKLLARATPLRQRAAAPTDMRTLGVCALQTGSTLLDLPPELRNLIYETLFEDHIAEWTFGKFCKSPNILLACKRIYIEAISVFYCRATFRAQSLKLLESRLRRLRSCHRRMITRLDIDTQHSFTREGGFIADWGTTPRPKVVTIEEFAECYLTSFRDLLRQASSLKELKIRSLRASIRLPNSQLVWTSEPTNALRAYKAAQEEQEKKSKWRESGKPTVARVPLTDNDWADGVWSSSLQTFVIITPD